MRKIGIIVCTAIIVMFNSFTGVDVFGLDGLNNDSGSAVERNTEARNEDGNVVKDEQVKMMLNMTAFERDADEPITEKDLSGLKDLSLTGMTEVSDWSWIKYCTNLSTLDLGNTNFSDAELIKAKNLKTLILASTPLEHAEALKELKQLEVLNISELSSGHEDGEGHEHEHGGEFDLSILKDMKLLKKLDMFEVHLENGEALSFLSNLEELDASMCEGFDISSIKNLTKLKKLHLSSSGIDDIDALKNLKELEVLHLDNNNIMDISALANLTNLVELNLKNNPFTSIEALENLTKLVNLDISKNSETSDDNKIKDIQKLSKLINITDLRFDYNKVEDISALSNMKKLSRLNIASNMIKDLKPIAGLDSLSSIYGSNNRNITDISPLSRLKNIGELQFNNCSVDNIKPLEGIYNGDSIFIFNVEDQKLKRYVEEKKLTSERRINLASGNKVKYILPEDGKGATIEGNTLILPKDFDLNKPFIIKFEDEFEKTRRTYSGEISVEFKADSDDISASETDKGNKVKPADPHNKAVKDDKNAGYVPETGDYNYVTIYVFIGMCISAMALLLKKRDCK